MLSRIRRWLGISADDDLAQEIDQHLEMLAEERRGLGATSEEAQAYARRKLGNRASIREAVYEMRPLAYAGTWAMHARIAARTFLRSKAAHGSVIAILSAGIGMSVAMFSLVDAVLLRPLPFPGQNSIALIWKTDPPAGTQVEELAYPELRDIEENVSDFQYVALLPTSLYGYSRVLQNGKSEPVQIESAPVSHDFFRVLGVHPALGRDFTASDERIGADPVVIVSDAVWREQLAADPRIIGHVVRLNGQGYTVIGVMAPGVEFPRGAGLWFPLGVDRAIVERRGATFLQAIARVKPGGSAERAAAEVESVFRRQAADHPEAYPKSQRAVITPLVEYWTGSARLHLWIMLGASVLLLLGSIVSAGNLLLSRALQRRHEIATRLALGAGYRQILEQLGAEGVCIAIASAGAGLAIAQAAIRTLVRFAPADIPRLSQSALDFEAFAWAAGIVAASVIACALIPGWAALRIEVESALREGGARLSSSRREGRMRHTFVATHAALTMVLLAVAALLVLSYRAMISDDIGFANRDALSMNLQLHGPGLLSGRAYTVPYRRSFYTELLDRLRRQPGVVSAAAVLVRPLEGTIGWDVSYEFPFEVNNGRRVLPKANYEVVTPDYFRTAGTPLLEGRDFSEHDTETSEPVAIISESLAKLIRQAGYTPLGYRIRLGLTRDRWSRIIGICGNARYRSITQSGSDIFVSYLQAAQPTNYVLIRGKQPAGDLANLVRRTLLSMDASQTIAGIATIGELIDANSARHRFDMILLLWFGACATLLGAGGAYSAIRELTADRQREIAIKIALGAGRGRLTRELVSGTLGFVLLGECAGAAGAWGITRLAAELFYGVAPRNPLVAGAVAAFVFLLSMTAAAWPAWRAASDEFRGALRR